MSRRMMVWIPLALACGGSSADKAPVSAVDPASEQESDRTVTLAPPAQGYQVVTDPYVVPANTEVEICTVVRVDPKDGEKFAWIHRMESLVSRETHHMNVFMGQFSFLDGYLGEGAAETALGVTEGTYDCADLSVMESAFPVFPSQLQNQHIVFPEGVAVPMPTPMLLIFSHHFVNYHDYDITINAALNVEQVDAASVEQVAGIVFDGAHIEIPADSRTTEQRTCVFERDVSVALVSTHTHEWADCATLHHYDGETESITPEPYYTNHYWDTPPILHFEPGTYDIRAGDGVHFACHYDNDTARTLVNDGTAQGEMCVFAAVTWPLPQTVETVTDVLEGGSFDALLELLGQAMGPCDGVRDDVPGPWSDAPGARVDDSVCDGLPQTQNTVFE